MSEVQITMEDVKTSQSKPLSARGAEGYTDRNHLEIFRQQGLKSNTKGMPRNSSEGAALDSCGRTGAALTPTLTLDDSRVYSSASLLMIGMGLNNLQGPRYTYKTKNKVCGSRYFDGTYESAERKILRRQKTKNEKTTHSLRGWAHPAEPAVVVLTLLIDMTKNVLIIKP